MKKFSLLIAALLIGVAVSAQTPQSFRYQAVARNNSGNVLANQPVSFRISILSGSVSGTITYRETHTGLSTNAFGLAELEIGKGTPVTGTFSGINWGSNSYYVQVEMDPAGGTSYQELSTSQLLSVPYALYSQMAGNGFSGNYNDLTNKPLLFDGTWGSLSGKPKFATVATSGSYTDLLNKPVLFDGTWNSLTGKPRTLGGYGITDAMGTSHVANGITSTMITNWNSAFGWGNHSGLYRTVSWVPSWTDVTGKPTTFTPATHTHGNITNTGSIGSTAGRIVITGSGGTLQATAGTATGQILYWNGSAWVNVPPGNTGNVLTLINGVPTWGGPGIGMGTNDVYNPITGRIWMDRNLGAAQVATSSTDGISYGHLYQWGRRPDGHQLRTSGTTTTLSSSDTPGHANFILAPSSPYDWRSPQNNNLWQGVSGTNNPCPTGYRLPTEAEWHAERLSWSSNNAAGAFASPLKLPVAGGRYYDLGSFYGVGSSGGYWSGTVGGTLSRFLYFYSSDAAMGSHYRASGFSVRCLKD